MWSFPECQRNCWCRLTYVHHNFFFCAPDVLPQIYSPIASQKNRYTLCVITACLSSCYSLSFPQWQSLLLVNLLLYVTIIFNTSAFRPDILLFLRSPQVPIWIPHLTCFTATYNLYYCLSTFILFLHFSIRLLLSTISGLSLLTLITPWTIYLDAIPWNLQQCHNINVILTYSSWGILASVI